jgi:hypothetical protein
MPAEFLSDATLGALFRYWDKKREARAMPARRDIDPIEMGPRLLPHLMLFELFEQGSRIRFRLVGTSLVKRLGYDPTGRLIADLPRSAYLDSLAEMLRHSYAEAAPFYAESHFRWDAKGRLDARHILLPLTTATTAPSMILIGATYHAEEVYPPQIRALDTIGRYTFIKRKMQRLAPEPKPAPALRTVQVA